MADTSPGTFSRLLSISQAITGQLDYQSVLQAFADQVEGLISHDHMDIVLLGDEGKMHFCYEVGLNTSWGELARNPQPTASSPIRSVLWGRDPYLLARDALNDERFHFSGALDAPIYTADLRSRVIVPMKVHGNVFGALNISNHKVGYYANQHVTIAQQCADLIAPYLFALQRSEEARKAGAAEVSARTRVETLRTGALQLTEGMEAERRRLAMDLHDQTLGDLARLLRRIAHFKKQGLATGANLMYIETELNNTISELRRLVEDLKPGVLELFGFGEAVEALLHKGADSAERRIRTRLDDQTNDEVDRLPEVVKSALYRMVQEAANNAMRHGYASEIVVKILWSGRNICLEVEDDGIGCADSNECSRGGISNMRTRAELIGAHFTMERGAGGRGTRVCITMAPEDCYAVAGQSDNTRGDDPASWATQA